MYNKKWRVVLLQLIIHDIYERFRGHPKAEVLPH